MRRLDDCIQFQYICTSETHIWHRHSDVKVCCALASFTAVIRLFVLGALILKCIRPTLRWLYLLIYSFFLPYILSRFSLIYIYFFRLLSSFRNVFYTTYPFSFSIICMFTLILYLFMFIFVFRLYYILLLFSFSILLLQFTWVFVCFPIILTMRELIRPYKTYVEKL